MLFILLQLNFFFQQTHFPVHPHPHIAILGQGFQDFGMFSLAASDHGGKNEDFTALGKLEDCIYHLLHRLLTDGNAASRTIGAADAGVKQAQIVIDFCDRSHRRAGIAAGSLLIDGNRRGQAFNGIHIGFIHLTQELAGVGRQGFHISALALGIDGVKGQGRFPRAA